MLTYFSISLLYFFGNVLHMYTQTIQLYFLSYLFSANFILEAVCEALWAAAKRERCYINSSFQFPAAATDCRSVRYITFHAVQQLNKRNQIWAAISVYRSSWRGGWWETEEDDSIYSAAVSLVSSSSPSVCLFLSSDISDSGGWRSRTLTFHQPSNIFWHLSDSPPRSSPWEPTQTERGAAGGQTLDQLRNMFQGKHRGYWCFEAFLLVVAQMWLILHPTH